MTKRFEIKNSTAEFLIFAIEGKEDGIQVMYQNDTIWCTQKAMAILFDCSTDNIGLHLKNIYATQELQKEATTEFFSVVQTEGERQVNRKTQFYNLDAIISVGYRVNSIRATQFRQWCTAVIRQFSIRGYVIDKKRMENGSFIGEDYFEHLLAEIREIRLSERLFYQKLTDIYATAIDYNRDAPTTKLFFKKVQNKMHYAVHGWFSTFMLWLRSIPAAAHSLRICWAYMSSPRAVISFTGAPRRDRLSHTLRVTPPADTFMCPGLLSRRLIGALLRPWTSTLAAPIPTTYSCSLTKYPLPRM